MIVRGRAQLAPRAGRCAVDGATALERDTQCSAAGATIFIALHVVRQDDHRRLQARDRGAERGVDDRLRLLGRHDRLHVRGDVREHPLQVVLLLREGAERRRAPAGRRSRRPAGCRIFASYSPLSMWKRARARGGDADPDLAGELRVRGRHEGADLLVRRADVLAAPPPRAPPSRARRRTPRCRRPGTRRRGCTPHSRMRSITNSLTLVMISSPQGHAAPSALLRTGIRCPEPVLSPPPGSAGPRLREPPIRCHGARWRWSRDSARRVPARATRPRRS